jgi:predicted kinase
MYRDRLLDTDAAACAELDQVMLAYGQQWIIDGFAVDPETLMTTQDLAEMADVSEDAVRNWVSRWPLHRRGRSDGGRNLYRWGDVIEHQKHRHAKRNHGSST